jgi:hypothetical protein
MSGAIWAIFTKDSTSLENQTLAVDNGSRKPSVGLLARAEGGIFRTKSAQSVLRTTSRCAWRRSAYTRSPALIACLCPTTGCLRAVPTFDAHNEDMPAHSVQTSRRAGLSYPREERLKSFCLIVLGDVGGLPGCKKPPDDQYDHGPDHGAD